MSDAIDAVRRFGAIARADLLQRTRSTRFLATLALLLAGSWWLYPSREAGYMVLAVDGTGRGAWSSAWVGMVAAQVAAMALGLGGFYLVRGTLARDIESRVWQLLVATPMTRTGYLFAKWCSHLVVLALPATGALAVGLLAQWVRAEDRHVDLLELAKPMLLLATPAMALAATGALWFDLLPPLRRTAGNVAWFFLWMTLVGTTLPLTVAHRDAGRPGAWPGDPLGVAALVRAIDERPASAPASRPRGMGLVRPVDPRALRTFAWPHWHVHGQDLLNLATWLALAAGGVLAAVPWLDRAAAATGAGPGVGVTRPPRAGARLRALEILLRPLQRTPTGTLVAAELRLALRPRRWWWWVALAACWGVQAFAPARGVGIAILAGWLLSLDVLAGALVREAATGTGGLVFTAPRAAGRLLAARAGASALLVVGAMLPGLAHLWGVAPMMAAAALVTGLSLAAGGLACAAVTGLPRVFEMGVAALAYLSVQGLPGLEVSVAPGRLLLAHGIALPVALALAVVAWRWRAGRLGVPREARGRAAA